MTTSSSSEKVEVDHEKMKALKERAAGTKPEESTIPPGNGEPQPEPAPEAPEEEKPKGKKRKRKKKAARAPAASKPPKVADQFSADAYAALWDTIFFIVAGRLARHWQLEEDEKKRLGVTTKAVLDRYLPDMITEHSELLVLGACLIGVTLPRIIYHKRLKMAFKAPTETGEEIGTVPMRPGPPPTPPPGVPPDPPGAPEPTEPSVPRDGDLTGGSKEK